MFSELNQNYVHHNPVLQVAANDLASLAGSQAMSESVWEQIIPNATAQRLVQTIGGNDRAFNSSVMQAYQFAAYQQAMAEKRWQRGRQQGSRADDRPPANAPASVRQEFQNKIRNYTRMLYLVRAITGFASPVSSSVEMQNLNIPSRLQDYITKEGSVSLGMQAAHLDHPEWDPWMGQRVLRPVQRRLVPVVGLLAGLVPTGHAVDHRQPAPAGQVRGQRPVADAPVEGLQILGQGL